MEQAIDLSEREEITREEVQAHIDKLETLQRFYISDSFAQVNIERINFNLNMLLLNSVFIDDPKANEADAYESLKMTGSAIPLCFNWLKWRFIMPTINWPYPS